MKNLIRTQEQFEKAINEALCEVLNISKEELLDNCYPNVDDIEFGIGNDEFTYEFEALPLCRFHNSLVTFNYGDNQFTMTAGFVLYPVKNIFDRNLEKFELTKDGEYLECNSEPFDDDSEEGYLTLVSGFSVDELTEEIVKEEVMSLVLIYRNGDGFNKYIVPLIEYKEEDDDDEELDDDSEYEKTEDERWEEESELEKTNEEDFAVGDDE